MIPQRKRTPEELDAIRGKQIAPPAPFGKKIEQAIAPKPQQKQAPEPAKKIVAKPQPARKKVLSERQRHSIGRREKRLAPAPPPTRHTQLPTHKHDARSFSEVKKREALAQQMYPSSANPAQRLKNMTAGVILLTLSYSTLIAAAITAAMKLEMIWPGAFIIISGGLGIYIAIRKNRSRHHAGIILMGVMITALFSALYYIPSFYNHLQ